MIIARERGGGGGGEREGGRGREGEREGGREWLADLLKTRSYPERDVDEYWSDIALSYPVKYPCQSIHGLHCNQLVRVFSVIHTS